MRTIDIIGYIFLFAGLYVGFGLKYIHDGLFLQGIALGCFLRSAYIQLKK